MSQRVIMIPADDIIIDTTQSRRGGWEGDELDQRLIESIQGIGLIHDCIVRPTQSKKYGGKTDKPYALVAGSRRFHALIEAGKYEIPCKIMELSDLEAVALSFSENIGRKELTGLEKMLSIVTWFEMLKLTDKSETEAIQEIAEKAFGGQQGRVRRMLYVARLPKEFHILIKEPEDRTEEEKHILEDRGIKPDFSMNFDTLSVVDSIFTGMGEIPVSVKAEKLFEILVDEELGIQKAETWRKQYEILANIRDKLKEGKTFEIVMNEVKKELRLFSMTKPKTVAIKIPDVYISWHSRACNRARIGGAELVRKVYFEWLKREAEKEGW